MKQGSDIVTNYLTRALAPLKSLQGTLNVRSSQKGNSEDSLTEQKDQISQGLHSLRLALSLLKSKKDRDSTTLGKIVEYAMNELEEIKNGIDLKIEEMNKPPESPPAVDKSKAIAPNGDVSVVERSSEDEKLHRKIEESIVNTNQSSDNSWSTIIGHKTVKQALKEAVILPSKYPHIFTGSRAPWRTILMYGPPGTGKTVLAKAVASEWGGSTFIPISSSDIMSKWMGESEQLVKALFQVARDRAPTLIFIDEIDALCSSRSSDSSEANRRVKNEFLVQIEGIAQNTDVLLLAATNLPWDLDTAVLRRFEQRLFVPLPTEEDRLVLISSFLESTVHKVSDDEVAQISKDTDRYSGSDLMQFLRTSNMLPVREVLAQEYDRPAETPAGDIAVPKLEYRHLVKVLQSSKATVSEFELQKFASYHSGDEIT